MSLINKEIVDFKVQAFVDGEFREITKADVLGKWSVFFFYPADFTFVCPTELEDLADKYADFKNIDCEIYSVSCDTHFVHKAWHDASDTIKKIKYPMLADPTGLLARAFDVMIEDDGIAERGSFIVNPEGKIVENPQADITLSQILPGEQVKTAILFATEKVTNLLREGYRLSVGIEDPMTDRPQVRLAMNCKYKNGKNILWDGLK